MHVLVTGASGFVGGNLVKRLVARGHTVTAMVRRTSNRKALEQIPGLRFAIGDLHTGEGLREAVEEIDCVQHVAGVLKARTPEDFHRGNVEGTRFVCQAIAEQKKPVRLVYCSSLAAAGPTIVGRPRSEVDAPAPVSSYGRSKLGAEMVVRQFADRIPAVILRPPIVYGPGDRDNIPSFLPMAKLGIFVKPSFGPKAYSVVHVEDLCDALIAAGEKGKTLVPTDSTAGVYFVSDGKEYSWSEFCDTLARSMGRERSRTIPLPNAATYAVGLASEVIARVRGGVSIMNLDKAREMREQAWTCTNERARSEIAFDPAYTLQSGMAHTIAWYRQEGIVR
ncbi:MAG: NAD-dependent epimerase/dehydratase family protein [Myxococcota bacterium]